MPWADSWALTWALRFAAGGPLRHLERGSEPFVLPGAAQVPVEGGVWGASDMCFCCFFSGYPFWVQ